MHALVLLAAFAASPPPPQAPPVDPRIGQAAADLDSLAAQIQQISADLKRLQGTAPVPAPAARTIASKCGNPLCDCVDCDCGADCPCGRKVASAAVAKVARPVVAKAAPAVVDVRAGHWNIQGDWTASKPQAIAHLRNDHPSKAALFEPLEELSLESILTLHDDAHEGRQSTVTRGTTSVQATAAPRTYSAPVYSSGCPGGVCPTGPSYRRRFFGWGN